MDQVLCFECGIGRYTSEVSTRMFENGCVKCQYGRYSDTAVNPDVFCKTCGRGKFTASIKSTSVSACISCVSGKYNSELALDHSSCVPCPAGRWGETLGMVGLKVKCDDDQCFDAGRDCCASTASSTDNPVCADGYQPDTTSLMTTGCQGRADGKFTCCVTGDTCIPCAAGKMSQKLSQTSESTCESCPVGKYSSEVAQEECKDCPHGWSNEDTMSSTCTPCSRGFFSKPGQTSCTACREGKYVANVKAHECDICRQGQYNDQLGQYTCKACSPGEKQPETGAFDGCIDCSSGQYQSNSGSESCKGCDRGKHQFEQKQTACIACEIGRYELEYYSARGTCARCSMGTYTAQTGQAMCSQCSPGLFQDEEGQTACSDCPVGFQQDISGQDLCKDCVPGKFQNQAQQPTCANCPAGFVQLDGTATFCLGCSVGKYQDQLGKTFCRSCPTGKFMDMVNAAICTSCPSGQFQEETGISKALVEGGCLVCPSGYWQNDLGSEECSACPQGWSQVLEGRNACDRCEVGKFQDNWAMATCVDCEAGKHSPQTTTISCKLCPLGWDQNEVQQIDCDECIAGRFANLTGMPFCTKCFFGRYSDVLVATTPQVCESCEAGYYLDERGKTSVVDCKRCHKGRYQPELSAPSLDACIKCENGTYADTDTNIDSSFCKDCSRGRYSDEGGMQKDIGTLNDPLDCKACGLGRFGPNVGVGRISGCLRCAAGKFLDVLGQHAKSSCKDCPAGKFGTVAGTMSNAGTWSLINADSDDQSEEKNERVWTLDVLIGKFSSDESCQPCYRGRYSSVPGISSSNSCVACSAGKYQDEFEQLNAGACESCPPGAFINETGAKSSLDCESCRPGKFISAKSIGNGPVVCGECQSGRFQNLRGEIECKFCPTGYFGAESGKSRCYECLEGKFQSTMDSIDCVACPAGRFGDETALECAQFCTSQCKSCDAGRFGEETGVVDLSKCLPCSMGRYSDITGRDNREDCKKCRVGFFNPEVGSNKENFCLPCGIGRYADETGRFSATLGCKACPLGRYADETGNGIVDRCKLCVAGLVGLSKGLNKSVDCTKCSAGKYSSARGIYETDKCKLCSKGRWSNVSGASESLTCQSCPLGTFQNVTGASSLQNDCIQCPRGRASNTPAAETISNCIACPPGRFMDADSSGELCSTCPKGYAQPKLASFSCDICPLAKFSGRDGSARCQNCRPGTKGVKDGATSCVMCSEGTFQQEEEQTECLKCQIGRYNNCRGSGFCFDCERGTTTYTPGSTFCVLKRIESVPAKMLDDSAFSSSQDDSAHENEDKKFCISWKLPEIVPDPTQTLVFTSQTVSWSTNRLFPPLQTNSTSLTNVTTSICVMTERPLYEEQVYMRVTPIIDDATGTPSPPTKVWAITSTCDDESYLDAGNKTLSERKCVLCPAGGDCRGLRRWQDVTAIFGWFRLHEVDRSGRNTAFWPCFKPDACLGSRNPKLEGRYLSKRINNSNGTEIDLARLQINPERCNIDHGFSSFCPSAPEGRCRLCRGCADGYWPSGHAKCEPCPAPWLQTLAVCAGVMAVLTCLYMFLQTALADAGVDAGSAVHLAQPMQKIALNHMQLVALAASFPLQWPPIVEGLFATFGVLGDAGDYIFNPSCSKDSQVAEGSSLFFQKQLLVLLLPLMAVSGSAVFWLLVKLFDACTYRRRKRRSVKHMRRRSSENTMDSSGIDSCLIVDALEWPTLMKHPTFLDKHIKTVAIKETLYKASNQLLALHIPQTQEFKTNGLCVEWIPTHNIINMPHGHQGCWKVHFPGKDGHDEIFLSNTEAVAARKRQRSDVVLQYIIKGKMTRMKAERKIAAQKAVEYQQRLLSPDKAQPESQSKEMERMKKKTSTERKQEEQHEGHRHRNLKKEIDYDREITVFDKFIATAVTVLYLLYPTVTRATFKLVACQTVGVNRYLQMDLDLLCWDSVHMVWVGLLFVPALLCYVVGLPGSALYFMHKNRNHLHHRIPRFHFGTLFLGFKHNYYYWEVITATRKTTIIMVAVFLTGAGTEIQALVALIVNLTALVLHMNFAPYIQVSSEHDTLHTAEMWALLVSFVTLWMGLFFFQESVRGPGVLSSLLTFILMAINILYVVVALRWFFILKLVDLDEKAAQLRHEGLRQGDNWCTCNNLMRKCLLHFVPEYRPAAREAKVLWKLGLHKFRSSSRAIKRFAGDRDITSSTMKPTVVVPSTTPEISRELKLDVDSELPSKPIKPINERKGSGRRGRGGRGGRGRGGRRSGRGGRGGSRGGRGGSRGGSRGGRGGRGGNRGGLAQTSATILPSSTSIDIRTLNQRVDAMTLKAGVNDALLRKQLADRHAKMRARMKKRNGIRIAKFRGKLDADVAHVLDEVLNKDEEVKLPAISEARIDAIVLNAQMGADLVRTELNRRRAAMLKRLEAKNKERLAKVQAACVGEERTLEEAIQVQGKAQLLAGGGFVETSMDAGSDVEEQEHSLIKLARRVDRLVIAAGTDAIQVQQYLEERHAQMMRRTQQRNKIRCARLSRKLDAEELKIRQDLEPGFELTLPSIPDTQIIAITLRAQMGAQVINDEIKLRKSAVLEKLHRRNQEKLESKLALCDFEMKAVMSQVEASGGKMGLALELPEEAAQEGDSLDVLTGFEDVLRMPTEARQNGDDAANASAVAAEDAKKAEAEETRANETAEAKKQADAKVKADKEEAEAKLIEEKQMLEKEAAALAAQKNLLADQRTTLETELGDTNNPDQFAVVSSALAVMLENDLCDSTGNEEELVSRARVLLETLHRLWLLKKAVADLNQKTIAEIKSFNEPLQEVIVVMRVVFLLLGHSRNELSEWKKIRAWIGKTGKVSLKRRIANFVVPNVGEFGIKESTVKFATDEISKVHLDRIQDISIGAMVFYSWASGVLDELKKVQDKK